MDEGIHSQRSYNPLRKGIQSNDLERHVIEINMKFLSDNLNYVKQMAPHLLAKDIILEKEWKRLVDCSRMDAPDMLIKILLDPQRPPGFLQGFLEILRHEKFLMDFIAEKLENDLRAAKAGNYYVVSQSNCDNETVDRTISDTDVQVFHDNYGTSNKAFDTVDGYFQSQGTLTPYIPQLPQGGSQVERPKASENEERQPFNLVARRLKHKQGLESLMKHPILFSNLPPANCGKVYQSTFLKGVFNQLSLAINDGHFDLFHQYKKCLHKQSRKLVKEHHEKDLLFFLMYLEACCYAWQHDYDKCRRALKTAEDLVNSTTSPPRYRAEIFSTKCWLHFKEGDLNRLEDTLSQAMDVIQESGSNCNGKAKGWIYLDEARKYLFLAEKEPDPKTILEMQYKEKVVEYLEYAMEQFEVEPSGDGPFGFCFAVAKLASVTVSVGDDCQFRKLKEKPSKKTIGYAFNLLKLMKYKYPDGMPDILEAHYKLTKGDVLYQKWNSIGKLSDIQTSYRLTKEAFSLAKGMKMEEEQNYAWKRLEYLEKILKPQETNHNIDSDSDEEDCAIISDSVLPMPDLPSEDESYSAEDSTEQDQLLESHTHATTFSFKKLLMTQACTFYKFKNWMKIVAIIFIVSLFCFMLK